MPLRVTTNVRQSVVAASSKLIELGTVESGREKIGRLSLACRGKPKRQCRVTSSVFGTKVTTAAAFADSASAKGTDRTPGGVGGSKPRKSTKAPSSSAPPSSSPPSSAPPGGGGGDTIDIDVEWNFCLGAFCFEIEYDMGGNGVIAQPDGSGDTVDGLPPTLRPGL